MRNCLVTKLNASVDNADLIKPNEIRLYGMNSSAVLNGVVVVTSYLSNLLRILGDNNAKFANNNQKELTIESASVEINTTAETDVAMEYSKVVKIESQSNYNLNLDDLKGCSNLILITARRCSGNIKNLSGMQYLNTLSLSNTYSANYVTGDISELTKSVKNVIIENPVNLGGDISQLVGTSINYIRITDTSNITGSIATFTNGNSSLTVVRFNSCSGMSGNVSDLVANNSITIFEVNGTQFVGTAAQIKEKFPNASVIDANGDTA